MIDFSSREAASWAEILGLVPVPMFGAIRAHDIPGTHAVMLDGDSGSFAWSLEDPRNPISRGDSLRNTWSSNLRWSVTIDDNSYATITQWADPRRQDRRKIRRPSDVDSIFEDYGRAPLPHSESVIDRALDTFGAVRAAIEEKGGSELDVILTFNAVLEWAAHEPSSDVSLADAIRRLGQLDAIGYRPDAISARLHKFPLGTLVQQLKEGFGGNSSTYLLDADLLIRHASGIVNQEAHRRLRQPAIPDRQQKFKFASLVPNQLGGKRTPAPRDIHHTPPSLARALVEVAIRFARLPEKSALSVVDPACGSGVFLIEAMRELARMNIPQPKEIRGIDRSGVAVAMADVCLRHLIHGGDAKNVSAHVEELDSLNEKYDWGSPNLILMNPPFVSWNSMAQKDRLRIKSILGPAYTRRPDTTCAFIFRGMESLAPGGVLASVVPSTFLESESSRIIRQHISQSGEYRIHLIGQFGFGFFNATVQPAFIVLSREGERTPIRIVVADDDHSDEALRALRMLNWDEEKIEPGFELYSLNDYELPVERWTPLSRGVARLADSVSASTTTTVADFFVPRLGVRVGDKSSMIVTLEELNALCPAKNQRIYFRPIADKIENGVIQPSGHIFYPYDDNGRLLLPTEDSLREALPQYFREKLLPSKAALLARGSRQMTRKWWEVSRSVSTWLAKREPRIVSQEFGRAGDFAFDASGEHAVVQGFGWCWKHGTPSQDTLNAYLAILNSEFFSRVLGVYCPRVQGGQFVLRRHFVERVPLPAIQERKAFMSLAAIGGRISSGREYDRNLQESLTKEAYGLTKLPSNSIGASRVANRFHQLAQKLEGETRFCSWASKTVEHPLYREIVALGEPAVPLLLKDMRDREKSIWSFALEEITGVNPASNAKTQRGIIDSWINWSTSTERL